MKFVKTGSPGEDWPVLDREKGGYTAYNINSHPFVEANGSEMAQRLAFWNQLANKYDFANTPVKSFPVWMEG